MKRLNLAFRLKPIAAPHRRVCKVCGFELRPGRAAEHDRCERQALANLKREGTRPGRGDAP